MKDESIKVTLLELEVLRAIAKRLNPWSVRQGPSRTVSRTLGRLARKGLIEDVHGAKTSAERFQPSPNGVAMLLANEGSS